MRCIVASEYTKAPPEVVHNDTYARCRLSLAESEAFQGWPPNVTDGVVSALGLSRLTRLQMIGNGVNAAHMRAVFANLTPAAPCLTVCPTTIHETTAAQLELHLSAMTDTELDSWFAQCFEGYIAPALHLDLKPSHQPGAKFRGRFSIPAGLVKSVEYGLAQRVALGYKRKVEFDNKYFITQGFVKDKCRLVPGTQFQALRFLGAFQYLNAATEPPPAHWFLQCPDQQTLPLCIPLGSKHFIYFDLTDAFETCPLDEPTRDLVVVEFNGDYYQYLRGAQGISQMAVFFNVHLNHGCYHALGKHWEEWWAGYVDDFGVFADVECRAFNRGRIFKALMHAMGKPLSSKDSSAMAVGSSMVLAGLHIDEHGVCVDDTCIKALKYALLEHPVTSAKEALHVIGVVLYANSAFEWEEGSWTEFTHLVKVLRDSINPSGRVSWGEPQLTAAATLYDHISNRPRAYMRPSDLVGPDTCLVSMTDASDTAVCLSLFLVRKADAKLVTKDDLQDRAVSRLVSVKYKQLSSAQQRWSTYEAELYGMVLVVKYYGSLITAATRHFPPSGPVSKIAFWCDSTTALGQMAVLNIPAGVVDYLSAKSRRFYSWADKVAYTRYWSLHLLHFPGDSISLPHMMTHMGDLAACRHAEIVAAAAPAIVAPMSVISYYGGLPSPSPYSVPEGYTVSHLNLSPTDVAEVSRAMLADSTEYLRVPLSDIYRLTWGKHTDGIPTMHRDKVKAWVGVRFFVVQHPSGGPPLLYCPTSFQAVQDDGDEAQLEDLTHNLVLVVPSGAAVRLTDASQQPAAADASHPQYGDMMQHDLRRDIVYLAHTNSDHPLMRLTTRSVRELCWFPKLLAYVRYHVRACPICIPKLKLHQTVGASIVAAERLTVVFVDHWKLPESMASRLIDADPNLQVLTLMCSRTRYCLFVLVDSDAALHTARAIHNRWYPLFSIPLEFKSDRGPGFTSECMDAFRKVMGVKRWNFSAAGDATHHAPLEHKHAILHDIIGSADLKGDILCRSDLEFYVARANARQNLLHVSDTCSAFEQIVGQPPRVMRDMALLHELDSSRPLTTINAEFIANLKARQAETVAWELEHRDEVSRRNTLTRDANARASKSTIIDVRVGSIMSHSGSAVTVEALLTPSPAGYAKARIRKPDGSTDEVRLDSLSPMADPTSELMIPHDPLSAAAGSCVFFDGPDGLVRGGTVLESLPDTYLIQDHTQAQKIRRRFTPTYIRPDGTEQPYEKPPGDVTPLTFRVPHGAVIVSGVISDKYMVPKEMLDHVASLGVQMAAIVMPVVVHTDASTGGLRSPDPLTVAPRSLIRSSLLPVVNPYDVPGTFGTHPLDAPSDPGHLAFGPDLAGFVCSTAFAGLLLVRLTGGL